jgi:hypothetical protein
MSRSTMILIVIIAFLVVVVIIVLGIKPDFLWQRTIECPDGRKVALISPEQYIIKYSGKKITLSMELIDALKQNFQVEDVLIQEASESVQILDQKLRTLLVLHNSNPCDQESAKLLHALNEYSINGSSRIQAIQKEIEKMAGYQDRHSGESANALVRSFITAVDEASDELENDMK